MRNLEYVLFCNHDFLVRFWDPVEDIFIGTDNVCLHNLPYSMDFDDQIGIID